MGLKEQINTVKVPQAVERIPRIKSPVLSVLNEQIKNELYSSQLYRSMASCLDDKGWNNAAKLFFKYADEELTHMRKFYQYIYDRNCKAIVPACEQPPLEFPTINDILNKSLEHEILVSTQCENIARIACENNDKTTVTFMQWFENEQIEEENKFRDLIDLVNLGIPYYELEERFEEMLG